MRDDDVTGTDATGTDATDTEADVTVDGLDELSVDPEDYGGASADSVAGPQTDIDLGELSSEEIVTDIQHNVSCIAFCHARVIALIDEADRRGLWAQWIGVKTLPEWVMHVASVTMHTAREYVRVMTALREMPKVKRKLADGDVSYSKVREVTRLGERIGDDEALRLATIATGSQISRISRNYQQLAASTDSADAPTWLPRDTMAMRTTEPGRIRITIDLEEDEAAEIFTMLDAARRALERSAGSEDPNEAEKGGAERGAEAPYEPTSNVMCLMEIVRAFPRAESAGAADADRARMLVHASAEVVTRAGATLPPSGVPALSSDGVPAGTPDDETPPPLPPADTTCRIEDFGGITSATAERLTCEALISGTIKDADGDVLMLGRSKRLVSRRQRLALSARDVCCQFPGCRARRRCEAHHIRPWSQGGATDMDNLILLCRSHHTAVHKYQMHIERTGEPFAGAMQAPAAFAFSLPDGSQLSPWGSGVRGRGAFDTAVLTKAAEEATANADLSTVGGGYGFHLGRCIEWMFEAEWRHARENNVLV